MSGRRGHQRSTIGSPASGAVRVLRDVVIERMDHEELVVISQGPAVIGEEMSLQLFSPSGCIALTVRVLDSRPVVIAGSMQHRLRVVVMKQGAQETQSNRGSLADTPTRPEIA
jgi:hypothetical protein